MPLWKFLAASSLSNSVARHGLARVGVTRHVREHVPLPAEVLHELRWQLDGVPFHALDARNPGRLDPREQQVQAMPEFVEDRGHFLVGERRGLAVHGSREVARQVGDRMLDLCTRAAAIDGFIHPRATLLALARVEVEVELADECAAASTISKKRTVGCQIGALAFADPHAINRLGDAEQARQHLILRKILAHFLFGECVAISLQSLGRIGQVPRKRVRQARAWLRAKATTSA